MFPYRKIIILIAHDCILVQCVLKTSGSSLRSNSDHILRTNNVQIYEKLDFSKVSWVQYKSVSVHKCEYIWKFSRGLISKGFSTYVYTGVLILDYLSKLSLGLQCLHKFFKIFQEILSSIGFSSQGALFCGQIRT